MTSQSEIIAHSLGKCLKTRNGWLAQCPIHKDSKPSLAISEENEKLLVYCFAGCDSTEVLLAINKISHLGNNDFNTEVPSKPSKPSKVAELNTAIIAERIWKETIVAKNSLVEKYLNIRGFYGEIPRDIRFHPTLFHAPSNKNYPAMVARVSDYTGCKMLGIHRTWLKEDGSGKALIEQNKMMLGKVSGGSIHLGGNGKTLVVGEGIESTISVQGATGISSWAALSTSGLKNLILPPSNTIEEIIIAADHDKAGLEAAKICAEKWQKQGRKVKVALPPNGMDFNDLLLESTL